MIANQLPADESGEVYFDLAGHVAPEALTNADIFSVIRSELVGAALIGYGTAQVLRLVRTEAEVPECFSEVDFAFPHEDGTPPLDRTIGTTNAVYALQSAALKSVKDYAHDLKRLYNSERLSSVVYGMILEAYAYGTDGNSPNAVVEFIESVLTKAIEIGRRDVASCCNGVGCSTCK